MNGFPKEPKWLDWTRCAKVSVTSNWPCSILALYQLHAWTHNQVRSHQLEDKCRTRKVSKLSWAGTSATLLNGSVSKSHYPKGLTGQRVMKIHPLWKSRWKPDKMYYACMLTITFMLIPASITSRTVHFPVVSEGQRHDYLQISSHHYCCHLHLHQYMTQHLMTPSASIPFIPWIQLPCVAWLMPVSTLMHIKKNAHTHATFSCV